jgi:uncharacterized RDD family membrane protein YckC
MLGKTDPAIAGPVRRILAYSVDFIVLALPLSVVGAQLFDQLLALGQGTKLIGLAALALYYGSLRGGTLGKRLVGIRVVDHAGAPISASVAVTRALLLFGPVFILGLDVGPLLPNDPSALPFVLLGCLLTVGLVGANFYLFFFNARTLQLVSDLIMRTYVVRAGGDGDVVARTWPPHIAIAGLILTLSLALPFIPAHTFESWQPARSLLFYVKLRNALATERDRYLIGFEQSSTLSASNLTIDIGLHRAPDNIDAIARDVAAKALAIDPILMGYKTFTVTMSYGPDFGLASCLRTHSREGPVAVWRTWVASSGQLANQPPSSITHATAYTCEAP